MAKTLVSVLLIIVTISTGILFAGCAKSVRTPPVADPALLHTEFERMLALVPDSFLGKHDIWFSNLAEAKTLSGFEKINSLDALAQLSRDQLETLMKAFQGVPEPQRINNWTQIAPLTGIDAWMVDQTIFDDVVPPTEFSILQGNFNQAQIREKLMAQGYQKMSYGAYDLLSLNEDFSPGNLGPISGQVLAQLNRVGFLDKTLVIAPNTAVVTSVFDTRTGRQKTAIDDPASLVLAAALGDVLSGVLIKSGRLMNPGFGGMSSRPFNFAPPADWGRLHQYDSVGMGYKDDGKDRSWIISLYYSDAAAAQMDAPVLAKRLASYYFNTQFEQKSLQSFKPVSLSDQFEIGQPTVEIYHGHPASTLTVELRFKAATPSSAWVIYVHDFRDLLFLEPDPSPYLAESSAPQPLTLDQATAQLKEKGYVAVDTAEKASKLAGYGVATPAFVPAGFVPVLTDVSGTFVLQKIGFGLPNAPFVPVEVSQKYTQSSDPLAPHGPFFMLTQTSQQHELASGTQIDVDIGGHPGKKVMLAPDGRPQGIHLAWMDGTRFYDLEGELTGPLDEATLLQVAASMGVH